MFYCPYCSTKTKKDEIYCVSCGKKLPIDISDRLNSVKKFNYYWFIPLIISILVLFTSVAYYITFQMKQSKAIDMYEQGEEHLVNGEYNKAKHLFEEALHYKSNFSQAEISIKFIDRALLINNDLDNVSGLIHQSDYQRALSLMSEAGNSLKNFQGTAVNQLLNQIIAKRDEIKVEQLKNELASDPDIYHLKTLLWEAEEITNSAAEDIAIDIRDQIVDYTFSMANEQLNNNQFSDALTLIEDGLKYVSDSEKLQSLKTTIEKEKIAFETAQQQRIELAINLAAEEQEVNRTDAIVLDHVDVKKDDKDRLIIRGEVSSVATIPVTSILIEYTLTTKDDNELLSNKVFAYPDKLFPGEAGKFEFTHYDIEEKQDIEINVNKIRWYTD